MATIFELTYAINNATMRGRSCVVDIVVEVSAIFANPFRKFPFVDRKK